MPIQDTIDTADAVVAFLNDASLSESITYARTFIPEFDPSDLANLGAEPAKGLVFPSQLNLERASRVEDSEDNVIEIGIGRVLDNEDADIKAQLLTLEDVKNEVRDDSNAVLTLPGDGDEVQFRGVEVVFLVPELLRKRVALSVVRVTYRGFD
jgi:hypothetical protein